MLFIKQEHFVRCGISAPDFDDLEKAKEQFQQGNGHEDNMSPSKTQPLCCCYGFIATTLSHLWGAVLSQCWLTMVVNF